MALENHMKKSKGTAFFIMNDLREVNFYDSIFNELQDQYGEESVSTVTIDSSEIPDKQIERFKTTFLSRCGDRTTLCISFTDLSFDSIQI